MAYVCCLAGIDHALVPMLRAVATSADAFASTTVVRLDVTTLGRVAPDLLVCDIDNLDVDPLELLRQIRFVLPDCTIAVYTGEEHRWARACHIAGANCLLSKHSNQEVLAKGLRDALRSGCYTDPYFSQIRSTAARGVARLR